MEKKIQKVSLSQILVYRILFESVIIKNLLEQRAGHHQNNGLEIFINREFFSLRFNGYLKHIKVSIRKTIQNIRWQNLGNRIWFGSFSGVIAYDAIRENRKTGKIAKLITYIMSYNLCDIMCILKPVQQRRWNISVSWRCLFIWSTSGLHVCELEFSLETNFFPDASSWTVCFTP